MDADRLARRMADRMAHTVGRMSRHLIHIQPQERRYILTPQQQLTRFLQHTPQSLEYIRQTRGDEQFIKYVSNMAYLWSRMKNG